MRFNYLIFFLILAGIAIQANAQPRSVQFDEDWKFHRGAYQGADRIKLDDSKWRTLDLPHDWSIEDLPGTTSPFRSDAISSTGGGFTVGGAGWYRKKFVVPFSQKGKKIFIQFDGVYMNSEVWLNEKSLGTHPYGYTTFSFDISDQLKYGDENTIVVKVMNEGENSRWYSGSGIYRHVWLTTLNPVHVDQWGTSITTSMESLTRSMVQINTTVKNDGEQSSEILLVNTVLNKKGETTQKEESNQMVGPNSKFEFKQSLAVNNPELWSVETPTLHTAVTEIYVNRQLTDRVETKFGIRTLTFDALKGFQLNGITTKLKGGCVHHDNGPLGARAYDRAEERKIELLKSNGYNAVRCSHNPPSPAFLDACDRLGMLVIDESFDMWSTPKNPFDYHLFFDKWWQRDVASMVLRDRNHPSIILWSIGNEIPGMETSETQAIARKLVDYVHQLDPSRLVTAAVNGLSPLKDPFFGILDIAGYNYAAGGDHFKESIYVLDRKRIQSRIMFGAESYALESFGAWKGVKDNSWVIGDFVWTAIDYIGEASIGWKGYWMDQNYFPWNLAYCGDIDICGWKRPQSFYRDALWKANQVSLFVRPKQPSFAINPDRIFWSKWHWDDVVSDWNWEGTDNSPFQVDVYSSCESVELFLNGKSLGKKTTNSSNEFRTSWMVAYQPGELKAVGYSGKKKINEYILNTAQKPTRIKMMADRSTLSADGQDLSYITVELVDEKGIRHPKADDIVQFEIDGPASIVAVGNANPISVESYQLPMRKTWQGRCLVIIKSERKSGEIKLIAKSTGFEPAVIGLQVR